MHVIKKALCMFCHSNCGILAEVENGRVTKVRGNPDNQLSRGRICLRPSAALEFHYHPDRVNYPLKRKGARGEGKWEQISWDQAVDEIAARLKEFKARHGAETVAIGRGTYRTYYWPMVRFQNLFGTPNMYNPGQICFCNTWSTHVATYGTFAAARSAMHNPNSKCVVLWGFNPAESYPLVWQAIKNLKKQGTKIIAVDPRRTAAAEEADMWLQLRPQTDGALLMGFLNVIINEGLYDKEFVEKWTYGFDKLRERVQEYPLNKVADICWVPAEKIREAARMYAVGGHALMPCGVKLDQLGRNQTQAIRAQCVLRAITGNLDVDGGEPFGISGEILRAIDDNEMELHDALPQEQKRKQIGVDRFRLFTWPGYEMLCEPSKGIPYVWPPTVNESCNAHEPSVWRAILTGNPYPVKALIIQGNNALLQATNTKLVYEALKSLDLSVVHDYFLTPTAMLADYVLPAADWLERAVVAPVAGMRNFINAGEKIVDPEYERRDDYQFWRELATRLGQESYWPWKTMEEACDYRFKPMGYTFKEVVEMGGVPGTRELKKYEKHGFATPTRKVELYSTIFEKLGYDPLPNYEEPAESPVSTPELAREYPFVLATGGRIKYFYHSEFRQIGSMRKHHPDPLVQIHPDAAAKLGIGDGDWVYLESRLGRARFKAQLFDGIDPRVVHAEHSWWFPEDPAPEPSLFGVWKSNVNVLLDDDPDHCDQICGGWPHAGLCKVYKA